MADDERRAEIEAVARAFSLGHGWTEHAHIDAVLTSYGPDAERAIAALDRVRDARGDDEGTRCDVCADAPYPWNCERCNPSAARSPQGEDHGARDCEDCGQLHSPPVYRHGAGCPYRESGHPSDRQDVVWPGPEWEIPASPSRDGTVAGEDVRALGWIAQLLDAAGVPTASYEAQGGGMCRWTLAGRVDHALRLLREHGIDITEGVLRPEFSPASTGDQGPKEENDRGRH